MPTHSKKPSLFVMLVFVGIYVFAWMLQTRVSINYDVGWLLDVTGRMMNGGVYVRDFFEVDPPGILYLYSPAVFMSRFLHLPIALSFQFYVFFLASLSLLINYALLQKIAAGDRFLLNALLLVTTCVFLLFPVYEFGQKEHLLIILVTPYLFLVALRSQCGDDRVTKFAISSSLCVLIGTMAGLGFCIKPYYFTTPFLVEGYYLYCKKNKYAWMRVETSLIFFVLAVYSVALLTFHQNYLRIELPLLWRYFYPSVSGSLAFLLKNSIAFYGYFPLLFFTLHYRDIRHRALAWVLALSLCGFLITYLMQHTNWYYHLLPVLSFATILFVVVLYDAGFASSKQSSWGRAFDWMFLLVFLGSWYFIVDFPSEITLITPLFLFVFCYGILRVCLRKVSRFTIRDTMMMSLVLCGAIVWLLYRYTLHTTSENGAIQYLLIAFVLMSLGLLMCSLYLCLPASIVSVMGIVSLLSMPYYIVFEHYLLGGGLEKNYQGFMRFMNQHAHQKPIYFFSTNIHLFPYVNDSQAILASRFEHLLLLPELLQNGRAIDNAYFRRLVSEDLDHYRPEFIFINMMDRGLAVGNRTLDFYIDYRYFLFKSRTFRESFSHYHYLTTLQSHVGEAPASCHVAIRSPFSRMDPPLQKDLYVLTKSGKEWVLMHGVEKTPIYEVIGLTGLLHSVADKTPSQLSETEQVLLQKAITNFCQDQSLIYHFQVYQRNA